MVHVRCGQVRGGDGEGREIKAGRGFRVWNSVPGFRDETTRARTSQWGVRATSATTLSSWAGLSGSEPRGAELLQVQVNGSRRVFGPLTLVAHRAILALAGEGKAGHNGCDGHQTDT